MEPESNSDTRARPRRPLLIPLVSALAVAALWFCAFRITGRWLAGAAQRLKAVEIDPDASDADLARAAKANRRAAKAHELVRGVPTQFAFEHFQAEWINLDAAEQDAYVVRFSLLVWGAYGLGLGIFITRWKRLRGAGRCAGLTALAYPPAYILAFYLNVGGSRPATLLFDLLRPWDVLVRAVSIAPAEGEARAEWDAAASLWNTSRAVIDWLIYVALAWATARLVSLRRPPGQPD